MRAARWLPVAWPLLAALWATVCVLVGIGHEDWAIVVAAGIGAVGGVAGAWFAHLAARP